MRSLLILLSLLLSTPAFSAPTADDPTAQPRPPQDPVPQAKEGRKANLLSDTTANWFHVGGGAGISGLEPSDLAGRFIAGAGAYTIGIYVSGELEMTFTKQFPIAITGAGAFGVHIPIPVVHPMIGLRGGGGTVRIGEQMRPEGFVGGQLGIIIRKFDGRLGIRINVDADAVFAGREELFIFPQLMGTVAFVF